MALFGPTGAERELRRRIARRGAVTFAEFMDAALYWADGGYYSTRQALGPGGDFYTAPLAHPVFGALIARQLHTMWRALGAPERFAVVEAGAGNGRLAADITGHAPALDPAFARALDYTAVDRHGPPAGSIFAQGLDEGGELDGPTADSRTSQALGGSGDLHGAAGYRARWLGGGCLPVPGAAGVVLANELLDAMPVHRVTVEDGRLREVFVTVDADGRFADAMGEPSTPALGERLAGLGVRLAEGCRAEISLAVGPWVRSAYEAIGRGYLLVIDYGHEAGDYYGDARRRGTLRCYAGHTVSMDPYARPGRQDIGAHIELTSLRAEASRAGFAEAGSMCQGELLGRLGLDGYRADIEGRGDVSGAVRAGNVRLMESLADPAGMGAFRVLAFAKGAPREGVLGAASGRPGRAPLSTSGHMPFDRLRANGGNGEI